MSTRNLGIGFALIVVALLALITITSGGDDSSDGEQTDGAFIAEMVPHHRLAVDMAQVALERGQQPEIKHLARAIVSTQTEEIRDLEAIHQRLFDEPLAGADHGTLGLPEHQMGMSGDMAVLDTAKPFDRTFIDMMVPHHQGAIRMARIELTQGEDGELMQIAEAIIAAQSREINQMNSWRTHWYGEPSPAGGVPPEDETTVPSHEQMGHG